MRQKRKKKIEEKKFEKRKKSVGYMSCVMLSDVIKFVLRHFLGFLSAFHLFALQLIHFGKIRGLKRLKMRFFEFCYYFRLKIWLFQIKVVPLHCG